MIIRVEILFLLLSLVFSDEHIPRQVDQDFNIPVVNNIHVNEAAVEQAVPDEANVPNPPAEEPHKDSSIKSLVVPPDDQGPNAGINFFRDSSYVTFTTIVGKRSTDCYFYKARKSFDVDFQVLKGGDFEIGLSVFDITNKKVSFHKPAGDGTIKVAVPPDMINTDYSVCLDNTQSSWHVKKVFIMIDVEGPNGINHPDLQTGEYAQIQNHMTKLDMMNSALSNVYESLMKIEQHQERRRLVEAIDRSIMESNYEYVTFWAVIQISLMVLVAALQLLMIRSLFDVKNGIGAKVWKKLNEVSGGRF